ncbi:hypothetical protein Tco_1577879 [Tanacetum coccineum]
MECLVTRFMVMILREFGVNPLRIKVESVLIMEIDGVFGSLDPSILTTPSSSPKALMNVYVDYVVELQSTNPNTTIKIAVERNIDPSLPTRVFKRIYGSFLGQVLAAVGLESNNGIYQLAYALVEAKSKSSWCWFLQCLGDDTDLQPYSNFTLISDGKKGWSGQAYKDLLWRYASATTIMDFEKCMLELKKMNPKAHEWLNKIPLEHWARSHFSVLNFVNFSRNMMGEVDINTLTIEQYLILTQGDQAPGMVKTEFGGMMEKEITDMTIVEYMVYEAEMKRQSWRNV